MQVITSFLDWENQSGWAFTSSLAISFPDFVMCASNFDRASEGDRLDVSSIWLLSIELIYLTIFDLKALFSVLQSILLLILKPFLMVLSWCFFGIQFVLGNLRDVMSAAWSLRTPLLFIWHLLQIAGYFATLGSGWVGIFLLRQDGPTCHVCCWIQIR